MYRIGSTELAPVSGERPMRIYGHLRIGQEKKDEEYWGPEAQAASEESRKQLMTDPKTQLGLGIVVSIPFILIGLAWLSKRKKK